jgi:hypothetical protein
MNTTATDSPNSLLLAWASLAPMSQQKPPVDNVEGLARDEINAYSYQHFL